MMFLAFSDFLIPPFSILPLLSLYLGIRGLKYRISANSFRGSYSFLNLVSCTVKMFKGENYSRAETIQGNMVLEKTSLSCLHIKQGH